MRIPRGGASLLVAPEQEVEQLVVGGRELRSRVAGEVGLAAGRADRRAARADVDLERTADVVPVLVDAVDGRGVEVDEAHRVLDAAGRVEARRQRAEVFREREQRLGELGQLACGGLERGERGACVLGRLAERKQCGRGRLRYRAEALDGLVDRLRVPVERLE